MHRIISSFLILFIFFAHSIWALDIYIDSDHTLDSLDSESSITALHNHSDSDNHHDVTDTACDHCCHSFAHTASLFSVFSFALINLEQPSGDTAVRDSVYLHSSTPPRRPPKA